MAFAAAATLCGGCGREQETQTQPGKWDNLDPVTYLTAFDMRVEDAQTRADIDFTSGAISWNSGDEALVYVPSTGRSSVYTYNGSCFEPKNTPLQIGTGEAYAYFPASAYSISDGKVNFTMPESVTEDPGNKLPMGGIIPSGGIPSGKERREGTFKSLGALLWVRLTAVAGKEETLSGITLENTKLALTGQGEVTWNGTTPSLSALGGGKSIQVSCNKQLSASEAAEFFLFAPAGTLEGLALTVTFQEVAGVKPYTRLTRDGALTLERNHVVPVSWSLDGHSNTDSAKGDPIAVKDGKVLFFLEIPAEGSAVRTALGLEGGSFAGSSVLVNGTAYEILINPGGEPYVEVAEAADGKYEAALLKGESLGLYGASADKDVVLPFSQLYRDTAADFEHYPRYAAYSEATGNVLSFKEAVALLDLKFTGLVKLSSVKVRSLGGETLSGRADYSYAASAFSPKESLDEAVVNCTNQGSFLQLFSSGKNVPVLIAPGTFSAGLEITAVTDNHLVMHKTITPGTVQAGSVYAETIPWVADEDVVFFEGFDNFTWGGNVMAGSQGFGYAPDASDMTIESGRDRDGYARAYTKVDYNVAGTGYIQPNTWDAVKNATVGSSHVLSDSYLKSRNLSDWFILYRTQEYQGVVALGTAETSRGVLRTPLFRNIQGPCDLKVSFDICLQDGNASGVQLQIYNGGHFDSCTIDGAPANPKNYTYKANFAEILFEDNAIPAAASMESAKTWHRVEVTVRDATDATALDIRSAVASGATLGLWVDNILARQIKNTKDKGNLRILYWNIQNGMWWDQGNNYDNFVAFVKKYDPDICIWCESESIYKTGSDAYENTGDRYLYYSRPGNWTALAKRYGHSYASISGRTDSYPQEVTSKYPITRVQAFSNSSNLFHGGGHFQITVNGTLLNIVTTHPYPKNSGDGNHSSSAQIESDNLRVKEMTYLLAQTVNKSTYSSEKNWVMAGDMNANSPLDCWYTGADPNNIAFKAQGYVLEHSDLKDSVYEFWNAGTPDTFCSSTNGSKDRRDFVYLSPALMGKTVRAISLNDSWTYSIKSLNISNFKSPSDHRPILVDIQL